jgi:serine/threonine protein kinase
MMPVLGAVIGGHRLARIVISDVLGTVYAARDERSGRPLLVRLLLPLAQEPAARRRFQIEMAAIARLDHATILPVEDWGEWEGVPYVVTADTGADRLSTILASGRRLRPQFVMRTLRDLAAALDHARLAGVVHGGVEPARVLVNGDGSVRLSDFGLTALVGAAPEPDVYGLAAIARHLLMLAPPPPAVYPAVDAVLRRGLSGDPQQSWETCGAMVAALQAAVIGRSAEPPAAPTSPLSRLRLGPLPRRLPLWIGLGALALVLIAVLAALAGRPSPSLTLSAAAARAGDTITVSGASLPPGQPGTIVLEGRPAPLGQFNADDKGTFKLQFVVPVDVSGSRRVDACWGGSCPLSQVLVVQGPTPTPAATSPSPSASPFPTPTSSQFAPQITLSQQAPHRGDDIRVDGQGFDPGQQFVVVLQQGDSRWMLRAPASPDGDGAFSVPVQIPDDARRGLGTVAACISVVGTGQTTSCAQQPVSIGH